MRRSYTEYLIQQTRKYGSRFRPPIEGQFIPFFESGERIKVRRASGEVLTGTIGITTGWSPVFLLMRRRTSVGSIWTLSGNDQILAVQQKGKYVPLTGDTHATP